MKSIDKHITSTNFAASFNIENLMRTVVDYLLKNRTMIAEKENLANIFATRAIIATPMSKLFEQCVNTGYIDEFATLIKPKGDTTSIPDMLTMNVVIDLKDFKYAQPLTPFKEVYDKLVVNITNLVRFTNTGDLTVSSVHELHSMYVKALLSRSYSSNPSMWLPMTMTQYVIKTYALSLAAVISRNEGLDYYELLHIAMIFALFMSQRLSYPDIDLSMPPIFLNQTYLGSRAELMDFCNQNKEYTQDGLTITKCCEMIANSGPSRLKQYNSSIFYRQCYYLGNYNDVISTYIAIEYPPYWVWFLLQIQSGIKLGGLSNQLKANNLLNPGKLFAGELSTTASIFQYR